MHQNTVQGYALISFIESSKASNHEIPALIGTMSYDFAFLY